MSIAEDVAALLRIAPDSWCETPRESAQALTAITAAGFIERRLTLKLQLLGGDPQRVIVEMTGEEGLRQALEAVVQNLWVQYGAERLARLRSELGEPVKPIVATERDEWRISEQGRLAREDLKRGDQCPIDFVLRRGFFNGRPRLLPDGRITKREPVLGYGRVVSIENAPSGPLAVDIAKFSAAPDLANAIANAMVKAFREEPRPVCERMAAPTKQGEPPSDADSTPDEAINQFDDPREDPYDDRVVWWYGCRLYLGRDTQVARLFWLLAKPVGRAHTLADVQRVVDGMETSANVGCGPEDIRKAARRVRKVITKLKELMRESELDNHFLIHRDGQGDNLEYSMIPRFGVKRWA